MPGDYTFHWIVSLLHKPIRSITGRLLVTREDISWQFVTLKFFLLPVYWSYGTLLFYLNLWGLANLENWTSYNSYMIHNYFLVFSSYPKKNVENDVPDCYFVLF